MRRRRTGIPAARESIFKRHENLTPLSIFVGFILMIVILQLITQGIAKYPDLHQPGEPAEHPAAGRRCPASSRSGMTLVMISGGIDLSVGMLASLVSIIIAQGISTWGFGVPAVHRPRHPRGGRAGDPDGLHHLPHQGGALHHHPGRHDHLPGHRAAAQQFARGDHERGAGLPEGEPDQGRQGPGDRAQPDHPPLRARLLRHRPAGGAGSSVHQIRPAGSMRWAPTPTPPTSRASTSGT